MGVCPRCGGVGYRSVEKRAGRYYVYYIHRDPKTGRVRKCYVGPTVVYDYVEKLHALGLSNIEEVDYVAVARRAVELYVDRALKGKDSERKQVAEKLEELIEFIYRKLELLKA
ncbi:MAG: putative integrase [Nanopusillaceae archaeon]